MTDFTTDLKRQGAPKTSKDAQALKPSVAPAQVPQQTSQAATQVAKSQAGVMGALQRLKTVWGPEAAALADAWTDHVNAAIDCVIPFGAVLALMDLFGLEAHHAWFGSGKLDMATYASNNVAVTVNLWKLKLLVSSPHLHVPALNFPGFTAKGADIKGFSLSACGWTRRAELNMLSLEAGGVSYAERQTAAEKATGAKPRQYKAAQIRIKGLHAEVDKDIGTDWTAGVSFVGIDLIDAEMPGKAKTTLKLAGGTSFAIAFEKFGDFLALRPDLSTSADEAPPDEPAPDYSLEISFDQVNVDLALGGGNVAGSGRALDVTIVKRDLKNPNLEHGRVQLINVRGVGGAVGGVAAGGISIECVVLQGASQGVLRAVEGDSRLTRVAPALEIVKRLAVPNQKPMSPKGYLFNVQAGAVGTSKSNAVGAIRSDIAVESTLPGGGRATMMMRGFSLGAVATGGIAAASATFGSLEAFLLNAQGVEIASIKVAGAEGMVVKNGTTTIAGGVLPHVEAHGEFGLLQKELVAKIPNPTAQAVVNGLCRLGATGDVSSDNLGVAYGPSGVAATGDLHATIDAPNVGKLELSLTSAFGAGKDLSSVGHARLALVRPGGAVAAAITARGIKASALTKSNGSVKVDQLDIAGDLADVATMLHEISVRVPNLPPTLTAVVDAVRGFGDSVPMHGTITGLVATRPNKHLAVVMPSVVDEVDVPGVGHLRVALQGVKLGKAKPGAYSFDHLQVSLSNQPSGTRPVTLACDGAAASTGTKDDAFRADRVALQGTDADLRELLGVVCTHGTKLSKPVRDALASVDDALQALGGATAMEVAGLRLPTVSPTTAAVDRLALRATTTTGAIELDVCGGRSDAATTVFEGLELRVTDSAGVVVGRVNVEGTVITTPTNHVVIDPAAITAAGDPKAILAALGPGVGAELPAQLRAFVAALDAPNLRLMLDGALLDIDTRKNGPADLRGDRLRLSGDVVYVSQGKVFRICDASLDVSGAHVTSSTKAGKPTQTIQGQRVRIAGAATTPLTSVSAADVVIEGGPVEIDLVDGQVVCVEANDLKVAGSATVANPLRPKTWGDAEPSAIDAAVAKAATTDHLTTAGEMIQDLALHATMPIKAGMYGALLQVAPGTMLTVDVAIKNGAIDADATHVEVVPGLGLLKSGIDGLGLGSDGHGKAALELDLKTKLGDKLAQSKLGEWAKKKWLGMAPVPLDLGDMITEILKRMAEPSKDERRLDRQQRHGRDWLAARTKAKVDAAAAKEADLDGNQALADQAELQAKQAAWEAKHARHEARGRDRLAQRDERREPAGLDMMDVLTRGLDPTKLTGTLDLVLDGKGVGVDAGLAVDDLAASGDIVAGQVVLKFGAKQIVIPGDDEACTPTILDGVHATGVTTTITKDASTTIAVESLGIDRLLWRSE